MATLKEHQAAMVDLLANGSGIPASASRLAHAMHDVLEALSAGVIDRHGFGAWDNKNDRPVIGRANDATTPGLNDKALSKREKALKTDSPAKWPTPAEQRVKELENTIKQLKGRVQVLKSERDELLRQRAGAYSEPEPAGCRKDDTQVCEHDYRLVYWSSDLRQCGKCGSIKE